jgi:hypothetical protein
MIPSSAAVQTFIGLAGLIITILGIKWAVQTINIARWTELKDFRDDCRSVQASGVVPSTACVIAMGKELEPPPYAPSSYFNRLGKRSFDTTGLVNGLNQVVIAMAHSTKTCCRGLIHHARAL